MAKKKLQRFADMETFPHVVQPLFEDVFGKDYKLKNNWKKDFFRNDNPVVLELGCGKGEYTVGLARRFPSKNFIGIDIKGSRMWKGARMALAEKLANVGFLRTRIELIGSFFGAGEVDEIWITFPDPQLKKKRKRLTSARFLNTYSNFLKENGRIHLKTDSTVLYQYTYELAKYNQLPLHVHTRDLYHSGLETDILGIQTFYERQFLDKGMKITYLSFELLYGKKVEENPEEDAEEGAG
jgi:tRNA (guanine-N7-)-methyltransferase